MCHKKVFLSCIMCHRKVILPCVVCQRKVFLLCVVCHRGKMFLSNFCHAEKGNCSCPAFSLQLEKDFHFKCVFFYIHSNEIFSKADF